MPTVSVIVPNYNHARHLPERLESIAAQTFRDYEVILLDDASTDGSREILSEFARRTGARCDFSATNSGSPFRQWNRGVDQARGELVWIAESDDSADRGFLEALVPRFGADPGVVLACCRSEAIDQEGTRIPNRFAGLAVEDRWDRDFIADGREECARYLVRQNTIPNASAVVFRREAFLAAGGAEAGMRYCGDWITWARVLALGRLAYCARRLSRFRFHSGSLGGRVRSSALPHLEAARVVAEILRGFPVDDEVRAEALQARVGPWAEFCWTHPANFRGAPAREFRTVMSRVDPGHRRRWWKAVAFFGLQRLRGRFRSTDPGRDSVGG